MRIHTLLNVAFLLLSAQMVHAQIAGVFSSIDFEKFYKDVQTALYNENMDINPDGKPGPQTRSAISKWQSLYDYPGTGELTDEQLKQLVTRSFADYAWAAVGSSTDGAFFSVWNRADRLTAETEARKGCIEKSNKPENCIVLRSFSNSTKGFGWIASVQCEGKKGKYISGTAGSERDEVISRAFDNAKNDGFSRDLCTLKTVIEARGRHK